MNRYPSYTQSYIYPPIRKRRKSHFKKLVYIFIGVFLIFIITAYFNERSKFAQAKLSEQEKTKLVSGKNESTQDSGEGETLGAKWSFNLFGDAPAVSPTPVPIKQDQKLVDLIKEKLPADNGTYSVIVKQLGSEDHQAYINSDQILPAASLYKLYLIATAYQEIEKGTIKEDTVITTTTDHLEQILGGEEFGYEEYEDDAISYTVDETLHRIAEISDNYAAIMLAEKLNWDTVRQYATNIGATHTTIKSPISTSASDIANFFDLLYQKKIVSPTSSDKIIDLLSGSRLNNRIPDQLPSSLKIAHKTGELAGVRHDAGIVFLPITPENEKSCNLYKKQGIDCSCTTDKENPANSKYQCKTRGPYLIVMMSNDVTYEDSAADTLSDISKVVFDYFNQLP